MYRGNHHAKRPRSRLKLVIVAVVLLLLAATIVWAIIGPDKKDSSGKKNTANTQSAAEIAYQKEIATKITFAYGDTNAQPTSKDIAGWYSQAEEGEGRDKELDSAKVASYIQALGEQWGIQVKDASVAADSAIAAIQNHKNTTITLEKQVIAQKTYTYCTNVRGVSTVELPGLQAKLASTYSDARGWNMGGLVAFKYGTTGCDFTIWLAADNQMTSFGGVCDVTWSCRSGNNVVLNFDRWQNASPTWNAAGLALDEYRSMQINHETGHRLGFSHRQCTGAGDPAPLMQQQSIHLDGCVFNAWPTQAELATFHQILGI